MYKDNSDIWYNSKTTEKSSQLLIRRILKLAIEEHCIMVQRESTLFEEVDLNPPRYDMDGCV
jgi:hypothetical protein